VQLVSESSVPTPDTARLLPGTKSFPVSSTAPAFSNRIAPPSVAVEAVSMAKVEVSATFRFEMEPPQVVMVTLAPTPTLSAVPRSTTPDKTTAPWISSAPISRIDVPSAAPWTVSDAAVPTVMWLSPPAWSVVPGGTPKTMIPVASAVKPSVAMVLCSERQRVGSSSRRKETNVAAHSVQTASVPVRQEETTQFSIAGQRAQMSEDS
jgi:hypothetical protein